ncbi:mannosyltransferase putative-domain-containing protein [Obelidium mucronatum]|nr:mannosyltransferase putative-domain-containing protein [Obelidium mucronatum]
MTKIIPRQFRHQAIRILPAAFLSGLILCFLLIPKRSIDSLWNTTLTSPTRGVVLMGAESTVKLAVAMAKLLRETGCTLPIEFAYFPHEMTNQSLNLLKYHGISTRDFFSPLVQEWNWTPEHYRLGAAKPYAILTSPFSQVLYLDPDVMCLHDPTPLFSSQMFKKFGAIFWPDFPATSPTNLIWVLTNQAYTFEREFESGQILIDKQKPGVLHALEVAVEICSNAELYFKYIWGDKEAFRWAFKLTGTAYFLNPNYLASVGVAVSQTHPTGNETLVQTQNGEFALSDAAACYCGQSMLQMDFLDDPEASEMDLWEYSPKPLFMHANGIKKNFKRDVPPFQIMQQYKKPLENGITLQTLKVGRYHWIGGLHGQDHCGRLADEQGVESVFSDFAKDYPGINERYMKARIEAEDGIDYL